MAAVCLLITCEFAINDVASAASTIHSFHCSAFVTTQLYAMHIFPHQMNIGRLYTTTPAVWLSGNALASISVVALRQTRLVPGWVTVCGRVNHLGM